MNHDLTRLTYRYLVGTGARKIVAMKENERVGVSYLLLSRRNSSCRLSWRRLGKGLIAAVFWTPAINSCISGTGHGG